MKVSSFILIFLLSVSSHHIAAEQLNEEVNEAVLGFNELVDHGTDALTGCNDGRLPPKEVEFEKGDDASHFYEKVELGLASDLPTAEYAGDRLTILTKEEADKLFQAFSEVEYMKFDYIHAGCEIRAHEFALMAKANGIEMGKAMTMYGNEINRGGLYPEEFTQLEKAGKELPVPDGFVGWRYHVAPYLLVRDGDEVKPYVFDIAVAKAPKTLERWKESLTYAKQEETRTFVKDRAYLYPTDNHPRAKEESYIQSELNKQELIREMGIFEFQYWDEKGLLSY